MSTAQPITPNLIQHVLGHCQQSFVQQICGGFSTEIQTILEDFKLRKNKISSSNIQLASKIYHCLIARQYAMDEKFNEVLQMYFKEISSSKTPAKNSLSAMLNNSQENRYSSSSALENKMNQVLAPELSALSLRMELLIGKRDNPFHPRVLARVLCITLEKTIEDYHLHSHIFDLFAASWPDNISTVYRGLNNYLVINGIMPKINTAITLEFDSKSVPEVAPQREAIIDFQSFLAGISSPSVHETAPVLKPQQMMLELDKGFTDLLNTLNGAPAAMAQNNSNRMSVHLSEAIRQLFQPRTISPAQGDCLPMPQVGLLADANLLSWMRQCQQQFLQLDMADALAPSMSSVFSCPIVAHRNVVAEMIKKHGLGLIQINRQLNSSEAIDDNMKARLRHCVMVNALSIMLDHMLELATMPEHIKYILVKLQLPMLKVVLNEPDFFTNAKHPAGHLWNLLMDSKQIYDISIYQGLEPLVNKLLAQTLETWDAQSLWVQCASEISKAFMQRLAQSQATISRLVVGLQKEENFIFYYPQVVSFLNKIVAKSTYLPVKIFIEHVWCRAFAKKWSPLTMPSSINDLCHEAKIQLHQALAMFETAVWATNQVKPNEVFVQKLNEEMPKLITSLKDACVSLDIAQEYIVPLCQILEKHQIWMNMLSKDDTMQGDELASWMHALQEQEEKFAKTVGSLGKVTASCVQQAQQWVPGKWFEFSKDKSRICLVWVSAHQTTLLFNNPQNGKLYKFEKPKLDLYLSSHQLYHVELDMEQLRIAQFMKVAQAQLEDKVSQGL